MIGFCLVASRETELGGRRGEKEEEGRYEERGKGEEKQIK